VQECPSPDVRAVDHHPEDAEECGRQIPVKIVLILGAGATLSDVATRPLRERPPLDRGFFRIGKMAHPALAGTVAGYMATVYEYDIVAPEADSLERVMGQIYTDTFNPGLRKPATQAFRALLRLFNRRVADTTNDIRPTRQRWLYRILAGFLSAGVAPKDMTIITYNQDLQVEKTLCLLSERSRWQGISQEIFNFPGCYAIGTRDLSSPTYAQEGQNFVATESVDGALKVLKLHGSLNWYSSHTSATPSQKAMFNPKRPLYITTRRIIPPDMTLSGRRSTHALPIVVPLVTHKSSVLHNDLRGVWRCAEDALDKADELIVFGYSCPPLDFESANQLRRSQLKSRAKVSVIDPDGNIAARYIDLLKPESLAYYSAAKYFLAAHPMLTR
jgi:hypothetical protein